MRATPPAPTVTKLAGRSTQQPVFKYSIERPPGPRGVEHGAPRQMGVAADDHVDRVLGGVAARPGLDLGAEVAEADMRPVEPLRPLAAPRQPALDEGVGAREEGRGPGVGRDEPVEAVAVQRHERPPAILPAEGLGGLDADQLGDEVGQVAVMVAEHPDDLGLAVLAKLADVREQAPGVGAEMAEAPVVEDVAEQDQPLEAPLLQDGEQVAGPGRRQAKVQVRHDQRVDLARRRSWGDVGCGRRLHTLRPLAISRHGSALASRVWATTRRPLRAT